MKWRIAAGALVAVGLFIGGFVAGHAYVWQSYCVSDVCGPQPGPCREERQAGRALDWTTPGIWGDRGEQEPVRGRALAREGTDLWGAFGATPHWRSLVWEDRSGQSIVLSQSEAGPYLSIELGEQQRFLLDSFLGVLYPEASLAKRTQIGDRLWATGGEGWREVGAYTYRIRSGLLDPPPDLVPALAPLGLELRPVEVGRWEAVGSGLTLEMLVAQDTVEVGGERFAIDAGGRASGGWDRIDRDDTLQQAAAKMAGVTGWPIEAPRIRLFVSCSDHTTNTLL